MEIHNFLDIAQDYAEKASGCRKVKVGAVITDFWGNVLVKGANVVLHDTCKDKGCARIAMHGNDDKTHRTDCAAVHAEVNAISNLFGTSTLSQRLHLSPLTLYVTRYPCDACAEVITKSSMFIRHVVWGRTQDISDRAKVLFAAYEITYTWEKEWLHDDKFN